MHFCVSRDDAGAERLGYNFSVAKSWNFHLNICKCVAMRFGGQKSDEVSSYYKIRGKFMEFISVHGDLGVS